MRRNLRSIVLITLLVVAGALALGFQQINIGNFRRGDDTLLGLRLGLDLQGGSHLVYRAEPIRDPLTGETRAATTDDMEALRSIIELRVNASGLGEPNIQILGSDRILIQLPGIEDPGRAKRLIGETAQLAFKHRYFNVALDLEQDGQITQNDIIRVTAGMLPTDEDEAAAEPAESEGAAESQAEGEAGSGEASPPESQDEGEEAEAPARPVLIIEFTDEGDASFGRLHGRLTAALQRELLDPPERRDPPGALEYSLENLADGTSRKETLGALSIGQLPDNRFALIFPAVEGERTEPDGEGFVLDLEMAEAIVGDNATIHFTEIQGVVDDDFGLSGDNLLRAYANQHQQTGEPIVNLEFDTTGTRLFGLETTKIYNSPDLEVIAIFLDDQELVSPRVIQPIVTGTAIIQGNFTVDRAREVALQLEGGRLPVPITLDQERTVDAILGADSLAKSVVAGIVGLGLVLLFMALYYRIPGVIASLALVIYLTMVLALFKVWPITLTLSGVAAVILSVGMAVDANILIFERMKEELRNGRTLMSAVNIGFNRAWPAIRDSNVSTLITCFILFLFADQLGTTIVQGFAVTLAIGVGLSMFSAIVVSRTLLRIVASTVLARNLTMYVPSGGGDLPQARSRGAAAAAQRS